VSALLRYAMVKSLREHLLAGLVLAPLVLTCAPLLGMAFFGMLRGQPTYPMHVPDESAEGTASMFTVIIAIVSALIAAFGAFWIFRGEIASRAVNFFFLARPPRVVSVVSAIYGFFAGVAAFLLARTAIIVLTATPPEDVAREIAVAAISIALGSALGSLLVAISSEAAILVVAYVIIVATVELLLPGNPIRAAAAVLLAAAMLQTATIVLRRRCAS
jgi:hypothetical protein